jgi:hypothetical protein
LKAYISSLLWSLSKYSNPHFLNLWAYCAWWCMEPHLTTLHWLPRNTVNSLAMYSKMFFLTYCLLSFCILSNSLGISLGILACLQFVSCFSLTPFVLFISILKHLLKLSTFLSSKCIYSAFHWSKYIICMLQIPQLNPFVKLIYAKKNFKKKKNI